MDRRQSPRLSAALAFYTMLSLAPLLIIIFKIVMLFMHRQGQCPTANCKITSGEHLQPSDSRHLQPDFPKTGRTATHAGTLATIISLVILADLGQRRFRRTCKHR
jgi:uncharacterized BrkB/YihY/UPF0761 family membrane protein